MATNNIQSIILASRSFDEGWIILVKAGLPTHAPFPLHPKRRQRAAEGGRTSSLRRGRTRESLAAITMIRADCSSRAHATPARTCFGLEIARERTREPQIAGGKHGIAGMVLKAANRRFKLFTAVLVSELRRMPKSYCPSPPGAPPVALPGSTPLMLHLCTA